MNIPVVFLLVSAIILIQITALLCMLENSSESTIVPIKSLRSQEGLKSWRPLRNGTSTALPSYNTPIGDKSEFAGKSARTDTNKEESYSTLSNVVKSPIAGGPARPYKKQTHKPYIEDVIDEALKEVNFPVSDIDIGKAKMLVGTRAVNIPELPSWVFGREFVTRALKRKPENKHGGEKQTGNLQSDKHRPQDVDVGKRGRNGLERKGKPGPDKKEVNWVIRIKQVVVDKTDDDGNKSGKEVDDAEIQVSDGEDTQNTEKENELAMKARQNRMNRRRLMEYSDVRDSNDISKEPVQENTDNSKDELGSGSDDPSDDIGASTSDADNIAATMKETLKKELDKADSRPGKMELLKNKLRNVDMSLLLGQDMPEVDDEPRNLRVGYNASSNENKRKEADEVIERLQKAYGDDASRDKDAAKIDNDYDIKDEMTSPEGSKMTDAVKAAVRESPSEGSQEKPGKRSAEEIDDVSGKYGVSVSDEDDENVPDEYDSETENGVSEVRYPRGSPQHRRRREVHVEHTTSSHHVVENNGKHHSEHTDHAALNAGTAPDHSTKHKEHTGDSKIHPHGHIIGIGYILLNGEGSVKSKHVGFPEHNEHYYHGHRRFYGLHHHRCNISHIGHHSTGHRMHPCHHGQWIHHSSHHVIGRPGSQHPGGYQHDFHGAYKPHNGLPQGPGGNHPSEFFFHENHHFGHHLADGNKGHHIEGHHGRPAGEVMMESFRSEQITGVSAAHHPPTTHSSNAVHVLVILSIFLICFTVVLFAIVKNRTSGHVREVNSRTALFVPQPKY